MIHVGGNAAYLFKMKCQMQYRDNTEHKFYKMQSLGRK